MFQDVIKKTLKEGHDYGVIPGTKKTTLYKPGAEKILMMMGVTSEYELVEKIEDYEKGFFAFTIRCLLTRNGQKITEGLGSCNTREKRYVNQDPYTLSNTCLKMAKKRAQVDASLTIASLSDVFSDEDTEPNSGSGQEGTNKAPEDVVVNFGKYQGKKLGTLIIEDKGYVEWLSKNAKQQTLKDAAAATLQSKDSGSELRDPEGGSVEFTGEDFINDDFPEFGPNDIPPE